MTAFTRKVTVPNPNIISDALGSGSDTWLSAKDVGKAVKLGAASHVLATAGADIDGFVNSIEPYTVNNGYAFGGILTEGRVEALVGANQGATAMAVGDYVVADTQLALGTASSAQQWASPPGTAPSNPTGPNAQVKTGSPAKKFWRCIAIISGTGAAGSLVILERD
ncbi:hypothetical protein [Methylovulum miyakonense]|uniref:hypothetical protein n=1 Tax=Methylovulum miyakonense TaxID=645578 RepID=UPI000376881A|nr:hypothetical protein [Methylovulum miyakonense]